MKKLLFIVLIASSLIAKATELTPQDIRERLEIKADIYITNDTGEKVISGPVRTNAWSSTPDTNSLDGNWSSRMNEGLIALRHKFMIQKDGSIHATIEEYASDSDKREDPVFKDLIEKKEFVIKNFEPIVWKVKNIKKEKYVVRYIPFLKEISHPISLESLPVAGSGITISDNRGYLWAEGVHFSGKYAGVTSHRGTLILSYVPFAGGKELGFAEGNQIVLSLDKNYKITLKAESSFLPSSVYAKIYAYYSPDKKTKGFNSLHTFDSSSEERIKEMMK